MPDDWMEKQAPRDRFRFIIEDRREKLRYFVEVEDSWGKIKDILEEIRIDCPEPDCICYTDRLCLAWSRAKNFVPLKSWQKFIITGLARLRGRAI